MHSGTECTHADKRLLLSIAIDIIGVANVEANITVVGNIGNWNIVNMSADEMSLFWHDNYHTMMRNVIFLIMKRLGYLASGLWAEIRQCISKLFLVVRPTLSV